jgi:ubiquinone/menaquinone biosynthesis C-methylase UbiE
MNHFPKNSDKKRCLERVSPEQKFTAVFQLHYATYHFAHKFIQKKVVLDIGCGMGYGSDYLAKDGRKVIGIDISNEAVSYAKNYYKAENLDFVIMDATKLGFLDNTFDVVSSFEVIEHLKDYKIHLSEISRVLKSDGYLLLSTPNKKISSPKDSLPLNPYHINEFKPKDLSSILSLYFSQVEIFGQNLDREIGYQLTQHPIKKILGKIDFLKIRKRLPSAIRTKIAKIIGAVIEEDISFKNFLITKQDIENAEVFVAVCKKEHR